MPAPPPDRPTSHPPAPGEQVSALPAGPEQQTGPRPQAGPQAPASPQAPAAPRAPVSADAKAGRERGRRASRRGCPQPAGEPRPLPDPAAMRLCLVPDSAPPYDADVPPPGHASHATRTSGQTDPAQRPREPAAGGMPAREAREAGEPRPHQTRPPVHADRADRPPATAGTWPHYFAQVLAETLAGSRPSRQMVPWTTHQARNRIQRLGPQLSGGQRPKVRRVVTFHPTPDVMEMTVVVGFGGRVRALAVRLERAQPAAASAGRGGQAARWLCTALEAA